MKCVCGYEHKSGINDNGKWEENLVGDEHFLEVSGSTFKVISPEYYGSLEIELYVCPKCKTVVAEL